MSHAFYNAQWQQAMEELAQQIEMENPPVQLNDAGKPLPVSGTAEHWRSSGRAQEANRLSQPVLRAEQAVFSRGCCRWLVCPFRVA
jgi:hypothetical protein